MKEEVGGKKGTYSGKFKHYIEEKFRYFDLLQVLASTYPSSKDTQIE